MPTTDKHHIDKLSMAKGMERDILLSSKALYEEFSFNEALAYRFMTIVNTSINLGLSTVAWVDAEGFSSQIPIEKAKSICKQIMVSVGSVYIYGKSDLPDRVEDLKKLKKDITPESAKLFEDLTKTVPDQVVTSKTVTEEKTEKPLDLEEQDPKVTTPDLDEVTTKKEKEVTSSTIEPDSSTKKL
jgi:hypothetical protein